MKIVIAPDSFKESLNAAEAAAAMQRGMMQVFPNAEYVCVPMADGGEGTAAILVQALAGEWVEVAVEGPLGERVSARYGVLPNGIAVMEMAQAAGLQLLPAHQRNPLLTSTYGVGQMIIDALSRGIRQLILGIGGSATNDGGAGMLQALGFRLIDAQGRPLGRGGAALVDLADIEHSDVVSTLAECQIDVLCDVTNPLCGSQGASAVYAPQKGADAAMVLQLDAALAHFAEVATQRGYPACRHQAGSGAAGGLGFGLMAFCGATLQPGVDKIIQMLGFAEHIRGAAWVLTGEGRMDGQTLMGKVPTGVLKVAQAHDVPVIAIVGCLGENIDALNQSSFTAILPTLAAPSSLAHILADAAANVERTSTQVAALLALGMCQQPSH